MFNVPHKISGILISLLTPTLLWLAYNNTLNPAHVETFLLVWFSLILIAGTYYLFAAYYGKLGKVQVTLSKPLEQNPVYGIVFHVFNLYFMFLLYGPVLPIMLVVSLRMINDSLKYVQNRVIRELTKSAQRNTN